MYHEAKKKKKKEGEGGIRVSDVGGGLGGGGGARVRVRSFQLVAFFVAGLHFVRVESDKELSLGI